MPRRPTRAVRWLAAVGLALLPPVCVLAAEQARRTRDLTRLTAAYKTPKEPACSVS